MTSANHDNHWVTLAFNIFHFLIFSKINMILGTIHRNVKLVIYFRQCCGSEYITFGSESKISAQFRSGSRVMLSILKDKIILNNFRIYTVFVKQIFFFNYKKIMVPEELFSLLSLWMVNLCFKFYPFCLYLIKYVGTCGDPDIR